MVERLFSILTSLLSTFIESLIHSFVTGKASGQDLIEEIFTRGRCSSNSFILESTGKGSLSLEGLPPLGTLNFLTSSLYYYNLHYSNQVRDFQQYNNIHIY